MIPFTAKQLRTDLIPTKILPNQHVVPWDVNGTKKIVKVIDHYGKHQGFFPKIGVVFHRILNVLTACMFIGTEKQKGKKELSNLVEKKYFESGVLADTYKLSGDKNVKGSEKKEAVERKKWAEKVSKEISSQVLDSYIAVTKISASTLEEVNTKCLTIFHEKFTDEKLTKLLNKNRPKSISDETFELVKNAFYNDLTKEIPIVE